MVSVTTFLGPLEYIFAMVWPSTGSCSRVSWPWIDNGCTHSVMEGSFPPYDDCSDCKHFFVGTRSSVWCPTLSITSKMYALKVWIRMWAPYMKNEETQL